MKKKMKKTAAFLAMLGVLYGLPVTALAAESDEVPEFELNQVLVTALRTEKTDLETPAAVNVYSKEDLEKTGAKNLMDALQFTEGLTGFAWGPSGQAQGQMDSRMILRGYDRGTLIMLNGAPINLIGKNTLEDIPLEAIEKVEVVKGSAATLYGAQARGGVINIMTKKALTPETRLHVEAGNHDYYKGTVSYSSNDFNISYTDEHIGSESRNSPDRKGSVGGGGYYTDFGGARTRSMFASWNIDDKWNMNYTYSNKAYASGMKYLNGVKKSNTDYDDDKMNLNLIYDDKENNFKVVTFFNKRDLGGSYYNDKNATGKGTLTRSSSSFRGFNYGTDLQKSWTLNDKGNQFLVGFTYEKEDYKSTYTLGQQGDEDNYGLYLQYIHNFNDRFTGIIGGREQITKNDFDTYKVFCPQFQTVYKFNDNMSWYTNIGRSFDTANLNWVYDIKTNYDESLNPEDGWNYETGIKIIKPTYSYKVALYTMDFKDKFDWKKTGNILPNGNAEYRIYNTGGFKNTGIEMSYKKLLNDNWSYTLGGTYCYARTEEENDSSLQVPRLQLVSGLNYSSDKLNASVNLNYYDKRPGGYYGEKVGSYFDVNLSAAYRLSADQSLSLVIENLFDRDNIVSHGTSTYYGQPFTCRLGWEYKF